MIKHYKSLMDKECRITLFGVGEVVIPPTAGAMPLEESIAKAIQAMTPVKILEEVTPIASPLITDIKVEDIDPITVNNIGTIISVEAVNEDEFTKADIKNSLDALGIKYNAKDTKVELLRRLEEE